MKHATVAVVDADRKQGQECCVLVRELGYPATLFSSLEELAGRLANDPPQAVMLDLDTVASDPQFLRGLKKKHPHLHFLGMSRLRYHPGLEEVIGALLYACLLKPLDPEELAFWLKSISDHKSTND
ncbi:MAG: response regulator [Deltaproteobacteria bacterium]|nr:response regulator [Deltaproteobacteria bacterium]